jgi:hypothetical protein
MGSLKRRRRCRRQSREYCGIRDARKKFGESAGDSVSIGIRGIKTELTPLFQRQVTDGPFETCGLVVKTDPVQLFGSSAPTDRSDQSSCVVRAGEASSRKLRAIYASKIMNLYS